MDYDLSLDEIKTTHLHTVEKVKLKVVSFGALPILLAWPQSANCAALASGTSAFCAAPSAVSAAMALARGILCRVDARPLPLCVAGASSSWRRHRRYGTARART